MKNQDNNENTLKAILPLLSVDDKIKLINVMQEMIKER